MRLSYDQLEAVCDAVPALLSFVGPDRRYRMCNLAYTSWYGLTREQIIGRTMQEILGDDAWRTVEADVDAAFAGERREFEREASFRLGGTRRIHAVYLPQTDVAGNVTGIAVLVTDITARKLTENALRESEARFRKMSDNSPLIIWLADADGRCTYLNERWYQFTGQTEEEALGFGWLNVIAPEDLSLSEEVFKAAHAAREPHRVEYRLRHRSGAYRWVIDTASPRFSDEGDFLGFIGSVIDIQERREVEDALRKNRERFDIVKDAAQVGFWFCDLPFDVLEWDNRSKEHFWLPPESVVTLETFFDRLHPDDREVTRRAIDEAIAGKKRYDIEYRTVDPVTRAEKCIRAIGRAFYDANDKPLRFDGVTLDITDRKKAEIALREAKEHAERASRAKDDFMAQLSHELRTPLTPVLLTATALAEDDSFSASARDQLQMIARNVALEARLIDDLLDLTRITHGKLTLRPEPCEVHALIRLVVGMVADEAREKRIELSVELTAERFHLSGDPARLQQVFWNLLRNAVKFTPEGGHVRIRSFDAVPVGSNNGTAHLAVTVTDDGIGFTSASAETLFQPFERGVVANDQRFPGLGLGLAIARAIVELHGGKIRAESEGAGRGATFTVELPGAQRLSPVSNGAQGQAGPAESDPVLRLLVVEDHEATLDVLTRLLRRAGHHVTTAGTVADAISAAEKETFDAVISDLGLPDGTGAQLMESLRAKHGLRGIVLSGYGTDDDLRRTYAAGFVAHLIKPVDMKEVRRALRLFGPKA